MRTAPPEPDHGDQRFAVVEQLESSIDLHHCPTCGQSLDDCGAVWPPSRRDVAEVRCRLPRGHRSDEHWHPPLWPATPDVLWFTDD